MFLENQKFCLEVSAPNLLYSPFLKLSKNLQILLGIWLPTPISHKGMYKAFRKPDLRGGLQTVYVYTNLIKSINIDSTIAPILSVFNYQHASEETQQEYEIKNPIYIPLRLKRIDSIQIELRTNVGDLFPFLSEFGECLCVIRIRPRKYQHCC